LRDRAGSSPFPTLLLLQSAISRSGMGTGLSLGIGELSEYFTHALLSE
jgi:hypothetical protein